MKSVCARAAIAATALVFTTIVAEKAQAACAAAEGNGIGYNTTHASQLAQFDARQRIPGAAQAQAQFSQPACFYVDNPNAAFDLVRCTVTASWCTTPPVAGPGPGFRPPASPPGGGNRCGQLSARATAGSLSQARTTAYRSIRQALRARGTAAGAPGVVIREPQCLYRDNPNARVDLVTCTMTATLCS